MRVGGERGRKSGTLLELTTATLDGLGAIRLKCPLSKDLKRRHPSTGGGRKMWDWKEGKQIQKKGGGGEREGKSDPPDR